MGAYNLILKNMKIYKELKNLWSWLSFVLWCGNWRKAEETCQKIETENPNTKCVIKEDKKGCEEIVIKPTPVNTTQENSSGFLAKGIQYLIIILCLFI